MKKIALVVFFFQIANSVHLEINPMKDARQPLEFTNKTHYFIPDKDKPFIKCASPKSYRFRQNIIEGYETRLYYEFEQTKKQGGTTFFVTLTYNDRSVPNYLGFSCFDYNDLVYLVNGGFKKQINRKFNCELKYFISAELGEGKGKRGFENNPHYHVLFFVKPFSNGLVPSPSQFLHLVKKYWQGFDEITDGWHNYKTTGKGIVKEGKFGVVVNSFRALSYCSKYVLKDVRLRNNEEKIREILTDNYYNQFSEINEDVIKYVSELVEDDIRIYRNRYCNKCRISNGVGVSALESIENKLCPKIPLPCKNGYKSRTPCLYLYRKLFCDKVKDSIGNTIYVLNKDGIDYKLANLQSNIQSIKNKVISYKSLLLDKDFFNKVLNSDISTLSIDFDTFKESFDNIVYESNICERYAVYKQIYEGRYFAFDKTGNDIFRTFPTIEPYNDYSKFLQPSYYFTDYLFDAAFDFLKSDCQGYLSYDMHPFFYKYLVYFRLLDLFTDYLFVQNDKSLEEKAKELETIRKFHSCRACKQYFDSFINL